MTHLEAAKSAEAAADRLSSAACRLQNIANALHLAAYHRDSPNGAKRYQDARASFKRVQRQVNDIMASVNDAEMNLHTAK